MKTCFKCGEEKDIEEFYRHPRMGDGRLGKCKACTKWDTKQRVEQLRSTPDGLAADRKYGRDKQRQYNANCKARVRPPVQIRAHRLVRTAVRCGRLDKPDDCEMCGDMADRMEAHHDDYAKPLDVRWLCVSCHRNWHVAQQGRTLTKPAGYGMALATA